METLSSSLTFFYKFVFSALWSGGFGLGTVFLFLNRVPEAQAMRWTFAGAWALGTAFIWWTCARLKRVAFDGSTLVISNYFDEITVPVTEIAKIRQNLLINLKPITITFERETRFGMAITFMPRVSFRIFSEDDIVKRLRSLARLNDA